MKQVAALSTEERAEIFRETAARKGITPPAAEKDFWLCWILMIIFEHPELLKLLKLKGGTSLTKCYGLIDRFSEDIDLILDWGVLTEEDPYKKRSNTKQDRFNKKLLELEVEYIKDNLFPVLEGEVLPVCKAEIDREDGHIVNIIYPRAFSDRYLRPEIRLEIGSLASMIPYGEFKVRPYAAVEYPDIFEHPETIVVGVKAERTFWEKVTILHVEAHRPADKAQPARYSRHYYDIHKMLGTGTAADAMKNLALLEDVVSFKKRFYPSGWANYDAALPGTIKMVPEKEALDTLKADYRMMREMIFGKYPDFDTIIESLREFEQRLNRL